MMAPPMPWLLITLEARFKMSVISALRPTNGLAGPTAAARSALSSSASAGARFGEAGETLKTMTGFSLPCRGARRRRGGAFLRV
jgi:hypothetical protein